MVLRRPASSPIRGARRIVTLLFLVSVVLFALAVLGLGPMG